MMVIKAYYLLGFGWLITRNGTNHGYRANESVLHLITSYN